MNDNESFDDEVNTPEEAVELSPANLFPWPPAEGESALDALGKTWYQSVFQPSRFFAAMPLEGKFGAPSLYAVMMGVTYAAIRLFWSSVLPMSTKFAKLTPQERMQHPFMMIFSGSTHSIVDFLLSPLYTLIGLLLSACVVQVLLWMLVKERGPFERTYRMLCFTLSPMLFGIVPILGILVGGIWSIVTKIIGVREVHRTTTGRATATVLLPAGCVFVFVVLLGILFAVIFGAGMMSKLQNMQ